MSKQVNLRLDERLLVQVDKRRGLVPRNRWISDVLVREIGAWEEGDLDEAREAGLNPGVIHEPEGVFEQPELDKWGNPVETVYDETDPRSWT